MSRRTGLSVSLLSQIERAESSASISSLYKIAIALEPRIQDLFGEYYPPRTSPITEAPRPHLLREACSAGAARHGLPEYLSWLERAFHTR